VASVRGAQCIVGLPAAGQALHHLILVRKFASILKLSRLLLYFFSERESIYPKLHTGYGFCPLPRSIKQFGKNIGDQGCDSIDFRVNNLANKSIKHAFNGKN